VPAGTPWTLQLWLDYFVWPDTRFGKDYKAAKTAKRLRKAFKKATLGDVIALEDADHALLKEIVSSPVDPQPGSLVSQFFPLMEAIVEAKDEAPVPTLTSVPAS
jgi:hypothetical protein